MTQMDMFSCLVLVKSSRLHFEKMRTKKDLGLKQRHGVYLRYDLDQVCLPYIDLVTCLSPSLYTRHH